MDIVIRAAIIYLFLLFMMRLSGKRQFSDMTPFDIVLLLIIAEATQNALLGNDFSITTALILIVVLIGLDILLSEIKQRSNVLERIIDGVPVLLMDDGRPIQQNLRRERVDVEDILDAARQLHGIERLDQVKYAILEKGGKISIIPRPASEPRPA